MFCWKCKKQLDIPLGKIGFRDVCDACETDLHVCKNCKYETQGKPNSCSIPNSIHVSDREKFNFCEDFSPKESLSEAPKVLASEISKRLFGENEAQKKRDFRSLFPEE